MHCCGSAASSAASCSAASRACPLGTTRLASPIANASAASTARPVRIMSIARLVPDQPGQPDSAAVDQRHTPPPAEHPEHRALFGHPQVAPQRELQAAGDRVATDRGDHRFGQHHSRRPHRARAGPVYRVGFRRAERLQIGSGAKGSVVAPQHRHRCGVVAIELLERREQRGSRRAVDGVARLRPVQDHRGHRAIAFYAYRIAHVASTNRIPSRRSVSSAAKSL